MIKIKLYIIICIAFAGFVILFSPFSFPYYQNLVAFSPSNTPVIPPSQSESQSQNESTMASEPQSQLDTASSEGMDISTYEGPIDESLKIRIKYPSMYEILRPDFFAFSSALKNGEKFSSEQGRILQIDKFVPGKSSDGVCSVYSKVCYLSTSDYLQEVFNNYSYFGSGNGTTAVVDEPTDLQVDNNPAKRAIFKCTDCFALGGMGMIPTPTNVNLLSLQEWIIDRHSGNVLLVDITVDEGKYQQFPPAHITNMLDSIELISSGEGPAVLPS